MLPAGRAVLTKRCPSNIRTGKPASFPGEVVAFAPPSAKETSMPNDPFVDVATLSSLGPIRYLDARDQDAFDAGHAPGAVRVPVEEWDAAAKTADIGFDKTAYWDEALGSLGVDPSAVAVT